MDNKEVLKAQEDSFELEDADQPIPPADIVAYNELRSCADLFRMFDSGKLELKPDFQRDVVWKHDDQSRFIDSLVKQLPIPSMCFSLDYKTQRWKVIDGLQRMTSIVRFLGKTPWELSKLSDIHPLLRGATNIELRDGSPEQNRLFAMVQDVSIPVTVIRCDYTQSHHMRYLFTIFHRLNSAGVRLNNQEIRNCIYSGPFNDGLKEYDKKSRDWHSVRRKIWGSMDRFRSVEVLLRVLAFSERLDTYDGNLAKFLNDFMHSRMTMDGEELQDALRRLENAVLRTKVVLAQERAKLPLAKVESVLVGVLCNLKSLEEADDTELLARYENLKELPEFAQGFRFAVSSAENVKSRIGAAILTFG